VPPMNLPRRSSRWLEAGFDVQSGWRTANAQIEAGSRAEARTAYFKQTHPREIKQLCGEIARESHPEKVILFGSHAYGMASGLQVLPPRPVQPSMLATMSYILRLVNDRRPTRAS
jgi:hypothetical protein